MGGHINAIIYKILSTQGIFCQNAWMQAKSLYRSRAWRHFYGTENEIWSCGLSNFQESDTKLERLFATNQYPQRKLLCFVAIRQKLGINLENKVS